ncbi:FAD-dependent monooxygenase [Chaetoceros tenuissimus]|uniref:FAD-dependent monooxygenase n=1 Tax=Chaetoceros tenuissimus TaxID=426638 RepID=A0AAD3D997_9STRA|nr:FAD-dependent monooxygenase [Chaetoceros tenuissimus]
MSINIPLVAYGPSYLIRQANQLYQRLNTAEVMLGLLPTGTMFSDRNETSEKLVSMFWSLDMSTFNDVKSRGLDSFKKDLISREPRVQNLLKQVKSFDQLIPAWYSDTFMPRMYSEIDKTVFIGDCAHATSHQLGQGANLALVDAWTLSKCISDCATGEEAMYKYDQERKWRLRFYQLNSRLLTPVLQSHSKVVSTLCDVFMGPMCKFPPTKLQMLTVLCGAQNNGIPWTTNPNEEYLGYVHGFSSKEQALKTA